MLSRGSGFFVDEEGRVATAIHCIPRDLKITVETADKRVFSAQLERFDPKADLAILKINKPDDYTVPFINVPPSTSRWLGNSIAIGYPSQYEPAFIASGFYNRSKIAPMNINHPTKPYAWIKTEAPVDEYRMFADYGFSGGPILRQRDGKLMGLAITKLNDRTWGLSETGAVPVESIYKLLHQH